MPPFPLPAVEAFLRAAFATIEAIETAPGERPVEVRLVFEAPTLREATGLADDLRRITRVRVRVRPVPLRRRWAVILAASTAPKALPVVRQSERWLHDLARHRPGCTFLGRDGGAGD